MAPLPPPPPPPPGSHPPSSSGVPSVPPVPAPPPPAPVTTVCPRHPARETWRRCTRCGQPACSDCLVQASVGSQCVDCVKAARPPAPERLRRWNAGAGNLVTTAAVAVNLGLFVWGVLLGAPLFSGAGPLQRSLGVSGPDLAAGEWYRLVTAGFVHFGLVHVAFNMIIVWQFGSLLEPGLGRVRFAALYLATVVAGTAGAVLLQPNALSAGASTAAFGLAGAVAVGFRHRGISVMQTGVGSMLLINFVLTFAIPGISIGGHLGGFLGGVVVGGVLLRPRGRGQMGTGSMPLDLLVAFGVTALAALTALWRVGAF